MRIAVNTRFLLKDKLEGFGRFTFEIISRMAMEHPDDQFIYFFDRPFDPKFITEKNILPIVLHPPCRHPLLFKIWFNYSVTRALKKHKADVFFSPDGYLSLRTNTPQVGVIHDINFEHFPNDIPKNAATYLRKYFPKFARKAAQIITVSEYSKKDIVYNYGIAEKKIEVAYNSVGKSYHPIEEELKKEVKAQFSRSRPYFLFVGALHPRKNLVNLLKSFDLFSSQSESYFNLLVVGDKYWWNQEIKMVFENLKYKDRVLFTGHLPEEELSKIMGAAEAFLFVSYFEGFGIPIIEAFKSGTPVICGNRTSLPEIAGDAAYTVNPFDVNEIVFAMEQTVKNDQLKSSLIAKGFEQVKKFNWDNSAAICYQSIVKASQNNKGA